MRVIPQKRFYIDVDDFELTTFICALGTFKKDLTLPQSIEIQRLIDELESVRNNK